MKCIPLIWPDRPGPLATFVLHKREIAALLDVPNKNPRSQWIGMSFVRRRLYVCDAHRFLCAEQIIPAIAPAEPPDEHYLPLVEVKAAAKGMKMTTVLLLSFDGTDYRVAAAETERKTWDLLDGDVIEEIHVAPTPLLVAKVRVVDDPGPAVPRISHMEEQMAALVESAEGPGVAVRRIAFRPGYLATFSKLDALTKPNSAIMHLGESPLDAALFQVASTDRGTLWRYVLMPMKS